MTHFQASFHQSQRVPSFIINKRTVIWSPFTGIISYSTLSVFTVVPHVWKLVVSVTFISYQERVLVINSKITEFLVRHQTENMLNFFSPHVHPHLEHVKYYNFPLFILLTSLFSYAQHGVQNSLCFYVFQDLTT